MSEFNTNLENTSFYAQQILDSAETVEECNSTIQLFRSLIGKLEQRKLDLVASKQLDQGKIKAVQACYSNLYSASKSLAVQSARILAESLGLSEDEFTKAIETVFVKQPKAAAAVTRKKFRVTLEVNGVEKHYTVGGNFEIARYLTKNNYIEGEDTAENLFARTGIDVSTMDLNTSFEWGSVIVTRIA